MIKERLENCKRIISILKKPDYKEFYTTARICTIGIILIGLIGFIIFLIANIGELL